MAQRRAGVLTVSDGCAAGEREDLSGRLLEEQLRAGGYEIAGRALVPDDVAAIQSALALWCAADLDLILTTGGTGFSPRDVTPEATRPLIERDAPGLAELLRWTGYQKLDRAVLSRGAAGIRGRTLIINLPGSTGGVRDGLEVLMPLLPHAIALLREEPVDHTPASHQAAPGAPRGNAAAAGHAAHPDTAGRPAAAPPALSVGQPREGADGHEAVRVADRPPRAVTVLETNLDDLSPELFEVAIERLFAAGALDVFLTPIQMKKGRPATLLSVIARPEQAEELAAIVFAETSAFGIRYRTMERYTLEREWLSVVTPYGAIRVKTGRWHGVETSASPEYEDVKRAAIQHGVPAKAVHAAALAAHGAQE